jgi:hypothetical protein
MESLNASAGESFISFALSSGVEHPQIDLWDNDTLTAAADKLEETIKITMDADKREMLIKNCLRINDHLHKRDLRGNVIEDRPKRLLGDNWEEKIENYR